MSNVRAGVGQILTFYSYKGGTGRSMALANVGCILAEKYCRKNGVLLIDWDLEAPGLHRYFHDQLASFKSEREFELHPGLIEVLQRFREWVDTRGTDGSEDDWRVFEEAEIREAIVATDIEHLSLLKAGIFDCGYGERVNSFDWRALYQRAPWIFRAFAEWLGELYDFVLIDSRTGICDISGVCTMLMPEKLVLVFTPNRQSLSGALEMARSATDYRKGAEDLRPLAIFPLPSRIEASEPLLRDRWRLGNETVCGYQPQFEDILARIYGVGNVNLTEYFDEVQIQQIPSYAYGECIAFIEERSRDRLSLARGYENFTERLVRLPGPWKRLGVTRLSAGEKVPYIFISHSSADKSFARTLDEQLRAYGFRTFLDEKDLHPGDLIVDRVAEALVQATHVIGLLSKSSVSSAWVQLELGTALMDMLAGESVRVIPVKIEECQPPTLLRCILRVDYTRDNTALDQLVLALREPVRPIGEELVKSVRPAVPKPQRQRVHLANLARGEYLIGRETELRALDTAWENPEIRVVSIVAWGGVGKTALVANWLARMAENDYRGAEHVFTWSFYSQGVSERGRGGDVANFLQEALTFFDDEDPLAGSEWAKGERLARLVAERKSLLYLDGLEPLQFPPGKAQGGALKSPAISALLTRLAERNRGLCLVTTRVPIRELIPYGGDSAPSWMLNSLSTKAGVGLLRRIGVKGQESDLQAAVEELRGHALTINLMGAYLIKAHDGDIQRRDQIWSEVPDEGAAYRVMAAYERWLARAGRDQELAILRLLGFFDRPATSSCLAALCQPPISGLTDALAGMTLEQWSEATHNLEEMGLLVVQPGSEEAVTGYREDAVPPLVNAKPESFTPKPPDFSFIPHPTLLDANPLVREYFARSLRDSPRVWTTGHERLFRHLAASVPYWPEGIEGLQPLRQAVYHGCIAGLHQEACGKIYYDRIQRRGERYSAQKLGAHSADLSVISCFFTQPWSVPSPNLCSNDQAWILNEAALGLEAVGQLDNAAIPMQLGMERAEAMKDWLESAIRASNLSALDLERGEIQEAVCHARHAIELTVRSNDLACQITARVKLADALHKQGEIEEAGREFKEAESLQARYDEQRPKLHSLSGFLYCEFLLSPAEVEIWRKFVSHTLPGTQDASALRIQTAIQACMDAAARAEEILEWDKPSGSILDIALHRLTVSRAILYQCILQSNTALPLADNQLDEAIDGTEGLRASGNDIPRGLLSRALLHHFCGNPDGALKDLREAEEISRRGGMKLHLADSLLLGAYLGNGRRIDKSKLREAAHLVDRCGYHLRKDFVERGASS